jgi:regulator of replication initiation timing
MNLEDILSATYIPLSKLPKNKLLKALQSLRKKYIEFEETIAKLKEENEKLKDQLKSGKINSVNKSANKPSSTQAEWDKKEVGNDGKGKNKSQT